MSAEKETKDKIREAKKKWEEESLKGALKRFGKEHLPAQFHTPLDMGEDWDFLAKVGFPGDYPFTSGAYAIPPLVEAPPVKGGGYIGSAPGLVRAGRYSGYGTPDDTRDYYLAERKRGRLSGPNIAFDLPTQIGLDSDDPLSRGEVGKVGVAVDTLRDFEIIYEAFTGDFNLDKIASNWTINAPANIIIAMYIALAEKRGIPQSKLRGTPQNEILKEFIARGTYIFPIKPSLRMVRDTIVYCTRYMPLMNWVSVCTSHIRGAGADQNPALGVGIMFSNAIEYIKIGIGAGLDPDAFIPRMSFLGLGGSTQLLKEVALHRAARRIWASITRDRFGTKNPRSWIWRTTGGPMMGFEQMTAQRPLNNIVRATIGGIACAFAGYTPAVEPPYDEPLGLGWSLEAQQLAEDAARVIRYETGLSEVIDPLAGSYYVESLTDQLEEEIWSTIKKIDSIGGVATAIERGYVQQELSRSAYQAQKAIEGAERIVVGVNAFIGEEELEVKTSRLVPHPYDPNKREEAEKVQMERLNRVKRERDNEQVKACLKRLEEAARDESVNLIPAILEAVKVYASIGEICGTLKGVFKEYSAYGVL